jgi:hypothetical protein
VSSAAGPRASSSLLDRFYFEVAPAERLGLARLLIGTFAAGYFAVRLNHFGNYARFRPEQFRPIGVVSILEQPSPAWMTWGLAVLAVLLGGAFASGWRFRFTGPAFAATALWVLTYRSSWGMILHTENLMCLHLVVLGLAASADSWSLDARGKEPPAPSERYGWPLRLMSTATVLAYVIAGVAKLRASGFGWVTSDLLRNYIAYDAIHKLELGSIASPVGGWLAPYPAVFVALAAISLTIELGAPIALLSPRLGRIWVYAIWGFHVGVLLIMAIFFFYPVLGLAYLSFFELEKLPPWLRRRLRRSSTGSSDSRA